MPQQPKREKPPVPQHPPNREGAKQKTPLTPAPRRSRPGVECPPPFYRGKLALLMRRMSFRNGFRPFGCVGDDEVVGGCVRGGGLVSEGVRERERERV